tara:strand:+ start:52128 stop:53045 length:918 start_codon:yes stop_codon:yes gene_type:complete
MEYKIVFFGVKEVSEKVIDYLVKNSYKIDLIVSIDSKVAKRNEISGYKNLKRISKKYSIDYLPVKSYSFKDRDDIDFFKRNSFEIGICHPWQRLIPEEILGRFKFGVFGFHGSSFSLPKGKGRSPFNWSLIEDKKIIRNNFFKYVPEADAGDIYNITNFEINEHDNIRTLEHKQLIDVKFQIKNLLKDYKNKKISLTKQKGTSTFYPKRSPSDGKIDFNNKTKEIYNLIRAVTKPFPGAFCYKIDELIYLWDAKPFDKLLDFSKFKNGEIIDLLDNFPIVKTSDGSLIIYNYEAKKKLNIGDILS